MPEPTIDITIALTAGIALHSAWKARLKSNIKDDTGVEPAQLEKDNARDLGKWIHPPPSFSPVSIT